MRIKKDEEHTERVLMIVSICVLGVIIILFSSVPETGQISHDINANKVKVTYSNIPKIYISKKYLLRVPV